MRSIAVVPAVTARAPAKVNLHLAVGGPRPDGYHGVATVFHAVGIFDEVTARPGVAGKGIVVSVEGEGARLVPTDDRNLVWQAAEAMAEAAGVAPDVILHVRKRIPVAAGMAGGSADAAATLVACDQLWRVGLVRDDLAAIGAEIGSDVPFALHGGTVIGHGRGEQLTPVLARGHYHWVFALASDGLSTPAVYREIDQLRDDRVIPEPVVSDNLMTALRAADVRGLARALHNDLQPAAVSLRPALGRVLETAEEIGALAAIVSGSGPTVALLARDEAHALDLAVTLSGAGVCRSVLRAIGPVAGARIVDPPPAGASSS